MTCPRSTPDRPDPHETWRREVFAFLVETQDRAAGDADLARKATAARFGVSVERVAEIEAEGLAADWPLPEGPHPLPSGARWKNPGG